MAPPPQLMGGKSDEHVHPDLVGPVYVDPTMPMVVDVRIEGHAKNSLDQIRAMVRTRSGRPLDPRMVEEDVRRLHGSKRFLDVRPTYTKVPGGVVLTYQVIERPKLAYVKYAGNRKVKTRSLAKQSGIKPGDSADPYAVEDARGKIEQWLRDKGHSRAVVTATEGTKPGDQGAVFMIHEGPIQRVGKVRFVGNDPKLAPDGRLQQLVQTKKPFLRIPYLFAGFKGFAEKDKVDADVDTLTAYYRALGYFQAKIAPEVMYDDDHEWATVQFVISEGVRYKVRNVNFIGNTKRSVEQLREPMTLVSGDYFNQTKLSADVTAIEEQYGRKGYLFAAIQPETRFLEQPGEVDLVYKIEEGARCRIGAINVHIQGDDPHTRRMTVLNRLDVRPGDIADIRKIRDSERRLKASGIFMVDPTQGGEPPKIVFRAPDGDEELESYAEKPKDPGAFRGQSPDPEDDMAEPPSDNDWIVDLVERPDNSFQYVPRGRAGALRPVAGAVAANATGRPPSDGARVRFQDMGMQTMPSFDVNAQPPRYVPGPNAYAPPAGAGYQPPPATAYAQPQAQPGYPQPAPMAAGALTPGNPLPSRPQMGPNYENNNLPAMNPRYNGSLAQSGTPFTQAPLAPTTPTVPAPQYLPPGPQVGPGLAGPGTPQPQVAPGVLPPPPGQGYDNFGQLVPQTNERQWLEEPTRTIPLDVYVDEGQTGKLMLGAGVNSNAGLVGNITLDEQNFDWRRWPRSWADIRNATAWRGAGQHFRVEAMPGSLVQRYMASFTEPYLFDTPISLGLSGYFFNRRYIDWMEERLGGRVSFGYQFAPDLTASVALRAENVNVSNPTIPTPQQLQEVLGNNGLYTVRPSITHDTRDSPFLASQGHRLMFAFEQAFGDFEFPRAEFEGSQYFLLRQRADGTGKHTLAFVTNLGFTGSDTPIFENFFAGGFGTLRGFRYRGASPMDNGVQVGGRFMWVNTVEYMMPITATDALRVVAFCDFGTVEQGIELNASNFRVAPGLGLRIAIPAMGPAPIALDFAVPVNQAPTDQSQVFSFNVGVAR
jgi:outer membrane protein insertion porin family